MVQPPHTCAMCVSDGGLTVSVQRTVGCAPLKRRGVRLPASTSPGATLWAGDVHPRSSARVTRRESFAGCRAAVSDAPPRSVQPSQDLWSRSAAEVGLPRGTTHRSWRGARHRSATSSVIPCAEGAECRSGGGVPLTEPAWVSGVPEGEHSPTTLVAWPWDTTAVPLAPPRAGH
jgi:hypothetical protein